MINNQVFYYCKTIAHAIIFYFPIYNTFTEMPGNNVENKSPLQNHAANFSYH